MINVRVEEEALVVEIAEEVQDLTKQWLIAHWSDLVQG